MVNYQLITESCFLVPDLFLLSISKPVIGLLPSKPIVQRKAMVLSFTSLISTSGGSGGSSSHTVDKQIVILLRLPPSVICKRVDMRCFSFLRAV